MGTSGDGISMLGDGISMVFSPSVVVSGGVVSMVVVSVVVVSVVVVSAGDVPSPGLSPFPHPTSNHPVAATPDTVRSAERDNPVWFIIETDPFWQDPAPRLRSAVPASRTPKRSPPAQSRSSEIVPAETSTARRCQPRETLPAFRQDVHTLTRCLLPPGVATARTDWMFGSHRRLVRRWECDTDLPKPGPFPQISHTAAISRTP